jgi:hypothetical protein
MLPPSALSRPEELSGSEGRDIGEATRVNIFASMKQRAKEGDFGLGGGMLIHASLVQDRQSDKGAHDLILHLHPCKAPSTIETDQELG